MIKEMLKGAAATLAAIALAIGLGFGVAKAATPNQFKLPAESGGAYSSMVVIAPTYVNANSLAANVAESQTVPATANFVIFSATCAAFYMNPSTTATVPGDTTDGSASALNPAAWWVNGVTTLSVIAPTTCIITFSFYK